MEFVIVKRGCYEMGDTFGDGEKDERPAHTVCVDDFYIGKYEVTQGQWGMLMRNNPSRFKKGDNYPVEMVSWYDVQGFIQSLYQKTGKRYRLPTEAEWEYAARSGGKREKYAGASRKSELGEYAWYNENSREKTLLFWKKKPRRRHPVGQKKPNGLGLYDMTGNVSEWCSDWYGVRYYSHSPKHNAKGPGSGKGRMLPVQT